MKKRYNGDDKGIMLSFYEGSRTLKNQGWIWLFR